MKKIIGILFLIFNNYYPSFAQSQKKVSSYFLVQYNRTIYDETLGNNPSGIGLGMQTYFNNGKIIKPTIELTGDLYLENDKVLRLYSNGTEINDVRGMVNLFAGITYNPIRIAFISVLAGPSFINRNTYFGVKPSIGFYFSENKRWAGKLSYINVFNRDKVFKADFGTISIAVGIRVF